MSGDYLSNKMLNPKIYIDRRPLLKYFNDANEFNDALEELDKWD